MGIPVILMLCLVVSNILWGTELVVGIVLPSRGLIARNKNRLCLLFVVYDCACGSLCLRVNVRQGFVPLMMVETLCKSSIWLNYCVGRCWHLFNYGFLTCKDSGLFFSFIEKSQLRSTFHLVVLSKIQVVRPVSSFHAILQ
ncbi:hypothetical protein Tsubulata_033910 [Turnera subulata]|uniref:Uncharacterized protein n=1 Tax=Turnera subulata TaxID=218843 RepID=A0A9Q0GB66_9ROSI|nr:hypothetical protein Tsubulata_033910 [Turnera subulata]